MKAQFEAFRWTATACVALGLAIAADAKAEDSASGRDGGPPLLEEFDKDGDGRLSPDERTAAREARQAKRIAEFDRDGDGKLSADEQAAARNAEHERRVKRFDTDGDGKLSRQEQMAARGQRRPPGPSATDADGGETQDGDAPPHGKGKGRQNERKGRGPGDRPAVDDPGNAPQQP
jgi:hypothetical protein